MGAISRLTVVTAAGADAATRVVEAWTAGRPVVVLDPSAPEVAHRAGVAAAAPEDPVGDDVAAVVLTSGTTGRPRAVELSWEGMAHSARTVSEALGVDPGRDVWHCLLPLHHVAGLAILARSFVTGAGLALEADDPATLASMVPTQLGRLDPSRYRLVLVGGGPLPPGTSLPDNAVTTYGMTETWGGVVHDGHALAGTELAVDPADGDVGPIRLRTPALMSRYRGAPAATARAVDSSGWFHTRDLGRLDSGGRLEVLGRTDDVIITGGVKVLPSEVEAVLVDHPAVAEVAVAGEADPTWGQRVVAYVVIEPGHGLPSVDELRRFARARLPAAHLPRAVVAVPALPRTSSGKLRRRALSRPRPGQVS